MNKTSEMDALYRVYLHKTTAIMERTATYEQMEEMVHDDSDTIRNLVAQYGDLKFVEMLTDDPCEPVRTTAVRRLAIAYRK